MLFSKKGMPKENELVFCTITKIQYHSVFANLEFYNKQGMIHISEVSPGRIRNIRDYVKEGKKVVCKVLRVNLEKNHIDLSLRRVSEGQRRQVSESIKQEQKAEKILEGVSQILKQDLKKLYESVSSVIFKDYDYLYEAFMDVVEDQNTFEEMGISSDVAKPLTVAVKEKIKPKEYDLSGTLELESFASNGVEIISSALKKGEEVNKEIKIRYLGAGRWSVKLTTRDAKEGEKSIKKAVDTISKFIEGSKGTVKFEMEHA